MAINCNDICELTSCKSMKYIAGPTDRAISWSYIKTMKSLKEWLNGNEIVFVLENENEYTDGECFEDNVLKLLEEGNRANVAAIVIMSDSLPIRKLSKNISKMANLYKIGLYKMPFNKRLIDINREIANLILEDNIKNKDVQVIGSKNLIELLLNGKNKEEVLSYCFKKIQPLEDSDKIKRSQLVHSLFVYMKCNCDMVRASKELYIHRNTMIARLKRITSLLNVDFNNPEDRNEFMNILMTLEYYGFEKD